jgi:hypothetical protein
MQTGEFDPVYRLMRLIHSRPDAYLCECVVEVLTESNCRSLGTGGQITRAWDLLMMLVNLYQFTGEWKDMLLSYFVAAMLSNVDKEIQWRAKICIIRLCNSWRATWDEFPSTDTVEAYLTASSSRTHYFGASVAEVMLKEELIGEPFDSKVAVPRFLRLLFARLDEIGAAKTEGIFRQPGNKQDEDELVDAINGGELNINCTHVATVASLTKRWLRELQEPFFFTRWSR